MFDKLSKEMYALTEEHAGKRTARATFWMALIAGWCVGLGIIVGALIVVTKFLLPYVAGLSRLPLPQLGSVALSFAIATAVVAVAGVWLLKTFRRTRDAVVSAVSSRLIKLGATSATDSRIGELLAVFSDTRDRVHHLESHAASMASTNAAFDKVHDRILPLERPPDEVQEGGADLARWAMLQRLNTPSAHSVGHPLTIDLATYGVDGGQQIDVTNVVESGVKDNRVRLQVNNTIMGRDPQWGVPKQLRVLYSSDGVKRQVTVPENEELKIPE